MKLNAVRLKNYKSFGEENITLNVEEINTIIGKNESGKTNLIDCLKKLSFTRIKDDTLFKSKNKNNNKYPSISVSVVPYAEESSIFGSDKETIISINGVDKFEIEGSFSDMIKENEEFQSARAMLNGVTAQAYIILPDSNQRTNFNSIIRMINDAEKTLFINYDYVNVIVDKIKSSNSSELSTCLEYCIDFLNNINRLLPSFVAIENLSLKTKYSRKDLEDKNGNFGIHTYLSKCIGFTQDMLLEYWKKGSASERKNFERDFNNKLKGIVERFNQFYSQDCIDMTADFDNDGINYLISTNGNYLDYEERSGGLKWYFNMFIQLLAKTQESTAKNYIILMDEPATSLHVDAQKEILKLFESFIEKRNQIIYTTHSPFMIYNDKLYRTKILIKDENGNSNIGNNYYAFPHKMGSKQETLTPLLMAMGMSMTYNITGIDNDKISIITEGISDYFYLKAYFLQKGINEYHIIPSTSVDNIKNIVSILFGWGCQFKIVLDQDTQGRGAYDVLTKSGLTSKENISFVDGNDSPDKSKTIRIEEIFEDENEEYTGMSNSDYNIEKAYYSLRLLKSVENKEYHFSEKTIKNFDRMMKQLFD